MESDYTRFYQTLGLQPGADWLTVRQNYRSLVRKWHPDRFTGDMDLRTRAEEKTKEITAAYQSLETYYRIHGATPASVKAAAVEPAPAPFTDRPARSPAPDFADTTAHD